MRWTIPNQLTILRILLTPFFLYTYSRPDLNWQLAGIAIFLIASLTDWYDGYIARKYGVITRFGQFMDPLADKILVLSCFYLFVAMDLLSGWMVTIIAVRDIFVTILRIYAISIGMPIITHVVAKWKTFFQMAFQFLILFTYPLVQWYGSLNQYLDVYVKFLNGGLLLITLLTVWSMIVYVKENFQLITKFFKMLIKT